MTDRELHDAVEEFNRTHPDYMEAMRAYAEASAEYERAMAAMNPYVIVITTSTKPL